MTEPFAPRGGRVAAIARRLGCTEGQLYSMVIGLLLVWTVSANALPHVVWERDVGAARAAAPAATATPPTVARPAGLLPAPAAEPVVHPLEPTRADRGQHLSAAPPTTTAEPAQETLTITAAGWASAAAGSPLATFGVPDGSVPVTRRGGRPFNVSFLRLSGNGSSLELAVDGSGTSTPAAFAGVRLCVITDHGWEVGRGDTSLDDAPEHDCRRAVGGVPSASGDRWTFDLAALDAGALPGVALVPAGDFPEFQIVFRTEV